jgi:hypothetical protein
MNRFADVGLQYMQVVVKLLTTELGRFTAGEQTLALGSSMMEFGAAVPATSCQYEDSPSDFEAIVAGRSMLTIAVFMRCSMGTVIERFESQMIVAVVPDHWLMQANTHGVI